MRRYEPRVIGETHLKMSDGIVIYIR